VINTAELAGRWVGHPGKVVHLLANELQGLQEGWEATYVQRIQIIKEKAVLHWGSIELQNQYQLKKDKQAIFRTIKQLDHSTCLAREMASCQKILMRLDLVITRVLFTSPGVHPQ
jgi:hypothetical protein